MKIGLTLMTAHDGKPGTFREVQRNWSTKDSDIRSCYLGMEGRITLQNLVDHLTKVCHESVDIGNVLLNFATVKWEEPASEEERAERVQQHKAWERRHEQWERETLAKLKAKYERTE